MKIIPMKADFSDDLYNMIKYLLSCPRGRDVGMNTFYERMGHFMLGRATGHTTVALDTAERLSQEGLKVWVVQHNLAMNKATVGHSTDLKKVTFMTYRQFIDGNVYRGFSRERFPDVVIMDTYTHFADRGDYFKLNDALFDFDSILEPARKPVYLKVQ